VLASSIRSRPRSRRRPRASPAYAVFLNGGTDVPQGGRISKAVPPFFLIWDISQIRSSFTRTSYHNDLKHLCQMSMNAGPEYP
jgi:hypothetical protein